MSKKMFSQDTMYSMEPIILDDYKPNQFIAKKKIKIVDEYYHWESKLDNDTNYLFNRTKYDTKGRIIEEIKYDGDYNAYILKLSTTVKWVSDTEALIRIIYNQDYNEGSLLTENTINGSKYIDCLSKKDSGRTFFNDVRVELNSKTFLPYKFIYLDYLGKPCKIYYPYLSTFYAVGNKIESSDTIFENKRIKKVTYNSSLDSQTINGYHQDAYTINNTFEYIYDGIGRVTDKFIVFSQSNKYFDTTRTKIIYYDTDKIKSVISNDGSYYGFYKGNLDFFYNDKGHLIRMTNDKNPYDSLIDEEYIYDKNKTIHRWSFFPASNDHRVTTFEEHLKDGLIQYTKYYTNKNYKGNYTIYKYNKKEKKLKNKIIIKLPN